jgi:hypothetical protein
MGPSSPKWADFFPQKGKKITLDPTFSFDELLTLKKKR